MTGLSGRRMSRGGRSRTDDLPLPKRVRYLLRHTPRCAVTLVHMGPKTAKVYDTLRERVVSGEYAPGDKLPSERALAEQLDVGRTALRQVLGRLVTEGIIERHQRSAYRVPRTMLEGSVPVPAELLEELQDRHGLTDEGLRFAMDRVSVSLVPVGDGWSIAYRVSLD